MIVNSVVQQTMNFFVLGKLLQFQQFQEIWISNCVVHFYFKEAVALHPPDDLDRFKCPYSHEHADCKQ